MRIVTGANILEMKFLIPLTVIAGILITLATTGFFAGTTSQMGVVDTARGIGYNAMVCVYKNGELIECSPNLFTNLGKNMTRDALGMGGLGAVNVIGVANNTVTQAATDTVLQGEWTTCNMGRATGTYAEETGSYGNWTIVNTFTSSCDNVRVNATGLYNNTVGNWLFAEDTFTNVDLQTNDQLQITWYIWVT